MLRSVGSFFGVLIVLALIGGPVVYALNQQSQMRNFRVVKDGVLYRSGQMSLPALKRVIHDYGIRTVVCLREGNRTVDTTEEQYCLKEELNYVRIPPLHWEGANGTAPVDEGLRTFLEVVRNPRNQPVLIHCFAGVHRTGGYVAVYAIGTGAVLVVIGDEGLDVARLHRESTATREVIEALLSDPPVSARTA